MLSSKIIKWFTPNSCILCSRSIHQNAFTSSKVVSLDELVRNLHHSKVYYDRNILILNKPYGLKKQKTHSKSIQPKFVRLNPCALNLEPYSLEDTLPALCDIYNVPRLTIMKCPDRYMSGLTILATNEKVASHIHDCMKRAVAFSKFPTYQAVCVGVPKVNEEKHDLGFFFEERKNNKNKKISFTNTWSKNSIKRKEIIIARLHHKVLSIAENNSACLIEICSNLNTAHLVRAFLATKLLTPVLGDHLFSCRVKYLFNQTMVGEIWGAENNVQVLLPFLKEKLNIKKTNEELTIPEHIHLSKVELPWYLKKNEDFSLQVDITSSTTYRYALGALNLIKNDEESNVEQNVANIT